MESDRLVRSNHSLDIRDVLGRQGLETAQQLGVVGNLGRFLGVDGGGHGGTDVLAHTEGAVVLQKDRPAIPQGIDHMAGQFLGARHFKGNDPDGGKLSLGRGGGDKLIPGHGHHGTEHGVVVNGSAHVGTCAEHGGVHGRLRGGLIGAVDPLPFRGDDGDILCGHGVIGAAAGGDGDHVVLEVTHGDVAGGAVNQAHFGGVQDGVQHLCTNFLVFHF